jgi:hypothetical protein
LGDAFATFGCFGKIFLKRGADYFPGCSAAYFPGCSAGVGVRPSAAGWPTAEGDDEMRWEIFWAVALSGPGAGTKTASR